MNEKHDDFDETRGLPLDRITTDDRATSTKKVALESKKTRPPQPKQYGGIEEASEVPVGLDMAETDDDVVPPVKEIRDQLSSFEMKVPVWGLTVFTVDGYIIAHKLFYDAMPAEIEVAVSSMSAGLITISEDFIRIVDSGNKFKQVLVDSEDTIGTVSFSILLRTIAENVLLACIFPNSTKLGLVTFEIENLSNSILDIVDRWDVKLHADTVT